MVVVGGGLAGCVAALAAREAGAEVTLLYRAPGATALAAPPLRVAGDPAGLAPDHPLARLGLDAMAIAGQLDAAAAGLAGLCARAGVPLAGDWRTPVTCPDVRGRPRRGTLGPPSVLAGDLPGLRGRRVAVAGFEQVGDYDAAATCAALRELAGAVAEPFAAVVPDLPVGAALSDLFGRRAPRPRGRPELVAYPPGLVDLPENGFELAAATATPWSLAFQRALLAAVELSGAVVARVEVTGIEVHDGRAVGVATPAGDRHPLDALVLATGRYLGGGLAHDRRPRERLLGLPVHFRGLPVEESRRFPLLEYMDAEAGFEPGLATDARLRPLDAGGRPVLANLHAAGAILAGHAHDPAWDLGVPLVTGRMAGAFAARPPG